MDAATTALPAMLQEIQARAPDVAAYAYVAVWALADMMVRARRDPADPRFRDITFPHTHMPLFSPEEAAQLELLFGRFASEPEEAEEAAATVGDVGPPQAGGGAQLQAAAAQAGQLLGAAIEGVPPEAFSVDGAYAGLTRVLDDADARLAAWSQEAGLRQLEDAAPDPKGLVPVPFVGPVPYVIPARAVLPLLTAVLEGLRAAAALAPLGGSLLTIPPTLALCLLDLGRGQVYHALYTLLALLGAGGFFIGLTLKTARNALSFVEPELRGDLTDAAFQSGKSFVLGASTWLALTLAPDMARAPLRGLLEAVRTQVEAVNAALERAEESARQALPPGMGATLRVTLPRLPADRVPTMATLYEVQGILHDPRVWCQPEVLRFVDELRAQPPLALFLDLLRIPGPGDPTRAAQCAAVPSLQALLAPRVEVVAAPAV